MKKLGDKLEKIEKDNAVIRNKFESPYYVQNNGNHAIIVPLNGKQMERLIVGGVIDRDTLVINICHPEIKEPAGDMFCDVQWPLLGASLPSELLGSMPPSLSVAMSSVLPDIAMSPPPFQSLTVQANVIGLAKMIEASSQCMACAIPRNGLSATDAADIVRDELAAFNLITDSVEQLDALLAIGRNASNQVNYQAELTSMDKGVARVAGEVFAQYQRTDLVRDGSFSGVILEISGGLATQRVNREGDSVRHDLAALSDPVVKGAVVNIKYVGGLGVVSGLRQKLGNER